jgi:SAM-dependent methyltransferase
MEHFVRDTVARFDDFHWWYVARRQIIEASLERHLHPSSATRRILDAGCGSGGNLTMLQRFGTVSGLELDDEAATNAAQRLGPGGTLYRGPIPEALPDAQFDVITMFDVLEHLDEPVQALSALRTRLAPQGQVVITVPAFQFLWSRLDEVAHHRRRYDEALLLSHLTSAGLRAEHVSFFNTVLFGPIAAARLLQRVQRTRFDAGQQPVPLADSAVVNAVLRGLFSLERHLVPRVRLPFGVSLLAVATPA